MLETLMDSLEIIASYGQKFGLYRKLNNLMKDLE